LPFAPASLLPCAQEATSIVDGQSSLDTAVRAVYPVSNPMKVRNLVSLFMTLCAACTVAETPPEYTAVEAARHIGEIAKVTGTVKRVSQTQGGSIFLDLGAKYPNNPITIFIPQSAVDQFPNFRKYDGIIITVFGEIKEYKNKPEIVVTDPSQIARKPSVKYRGLSPDEPVPGL
jgi:DNA/RNA endonuclease YhcR with UshA esterase domain